MTLLYTKANQQSILKSKLAMNRSRSQPKRYCQHELQKNGSEVKFQDKYLIQKCIKLGKYAKVEKGIDKLKKSKVAVKLISKKDIEGVKDEPHLFRGLKTEATFIMKLNHKNIIKGIEVFESRQKLILVMEYCDCNLKQLIDKKGYSSQKQVLDAFHQIVRGLHYLHKNKIIHRNLNCENILVQDGVYKICDFQTSKLLKEAASDADQNQLVMTNIGSPCSIAPEIALNHYYGTEADVWSLGTVLFYMFYGKYPIECDFNYNNINKIGYFQQENHTKHGFAISNRTARLITLMLNVDRFHRINCEQLLDHLNSNLNFVEDAAKISRIQGVDEYKVQELIQFMKKNLWFSKNFKVQCRLASISIKKIKRSNEKYFISMFQILFHCLKIDQFYKCSRKIKDILCTYKEDTREEVEFMILILIRCIKSIEGWQQNVKGLSYLRNYQLKTRVVQYYYRFQAKLKMEYDEYNSKLKKIKQKWVNILKETFEKTLKMKFHEQKDRFFVEIDKNNCDLKEQLRFINEYYKMHIMPKLVELKKQSDVMNPVNLYLKLRQFNSFDSVNMATFRETIKDYNI